MLKINSIAGETYKPIVWDSQQEELWNLIVYLSTLQEDTQKRILSSMDNDTYRKLMFFILFLEREGVLTADLTLYSDIINIPQTPCLEKIHLEITHRCNFKCRGCYLGKRIRKATDNDLESNCFEKWSKVIDKAKRLGCKYVTVTGGEPFLHKDLYLILRKLTEEGMKIEINTNGSLINQEAARMLRSFSIESVEISVYGYSEASSSGYTRTKGSHSATMSGIKYLKDNNIPFSVKYFATRDTKDGFDNIKRELNSMGINIRNIGYSIHGDIFDGFIAPKELQAQFSEEEKPIVFQDEMLPCFPSTTGLAVEPDGKIRACPKLTIHFGNAFNEDLEHIWNCSLYLKEFRSFWVWYCNKNGFVKGSKSGSLCPVSNMLCKDGGLNEIKMLWNNWYKEKIDG